MCGDCYRQVYIWIHAYTTLNRVISLQNVYILTVISTFRGQSEDLNITGINFLPATQSIRGLYQLSVFSVLQHLPTLFSFSFFLYPKCLPPHLGQSRFLKMPTSIMLFLPIVGARVCRHALAEETKRRNRAEYGTRRYSLHLPPSQI